MKLRNAVDGLLRLDAQFGPDPQRYADTDMAFGLIMSAYRTGALTRPDLERLWSEMPNAFGADTLMGHGLRKPYGYAGDFEMIDRIYLGVVSDNPHARRWDEYFQSRPACTAVRNRRSYFTSRLLSCTRHDRKAAVLNVASGPARDVADFLGRCGSNNPTEIDCVDLDAAAISHAERLCGHYLGAVRFHHANIFRWHATGRYDLIWSAGLFDYLDNRSFVSLLRHLSAFLAPGGRMVVGNFSPANPTRDFMEFGEWFLHHRNEDELLAIAQQSGSAPGQAWIESEPSGINLFLNIEKDERASGSRPVR